MRKTRLKKGELAWCFVGCEWEMLSAAITLMTIFNDKWHLNAKSADKMHFDICE